MYISDFESRTQTPRQDEQRAWDIAATVVDPEIPVLSIADLGILRHVKVTQEHGAGQHVKVTITPTYSGCPAMDAIRDDLKTAFEKEGYTDVEVDLVLAPAWSTDWM
ncbi:MAG: phenylacetate-CoA oxygenase subunit PaaJ, partial [Arthrobacter sp.]|nr:phenylacetate-CoA oxygenase subunit PaaJ [Arthrobacter sp.]